MPSLEDIRSAVASTRSWALDALSEWVTYASIFGNERPAQEYAAGLYDGLDLAPKLLPVDVDRIKNLPGYSPVKWSYSDRPNLVGIHDPGTQEGRTLVFNGHIDVVSAEPTRLWESDPFQPKRIVEEGEEWLAGRGAADMKGGSICFLWAMAALRELGLEPASRVIFQSPIEEESSGNGTLALLADGYGGDACIIPEPFGETVLLRQIGMLWFELHVTGRTTHVEKASAGVNAIEKTFLLVQALRALEAEANRPERIPPGYRDVEHPLNLNIGIIRGGDWASTVPGECSSRFRFAAFPGERIDDVLRRIRTCVAEAASEDPWLSDNPPVVEFVGFQAEGCEFDPASDLGQVLRKAHSAWRGSNPAPFVSTATTDIRFFNLYYDTPATCYGPVGRNIHAADECVNLSSVRNVTEVYIQLLSDWCGLKRRS
jgi:acetylornithine deacetylase